MKYILGIDTGGTYTDGVLIDVSSHKIIKTSKAFTTKDNLSIGIKNCIEKLGYENFKEITMVCLSTTLATNAMVEGISTKVALFLSGKDDGACYPFCETITVGGLLDIKGRQIKNISEDIIKSELYRIKDNVDAIAISGVFSVRNPIHENKIAQIIRDNSNIPLICAKDLSTTLGFYDRTVTTIINARLIPVIAEFISNVKIAIYEYLSPNTKIMIVKGDGNLVDLEYAINKPIETILSGPAASCIGGRFLTNLDDALIVDIGGTTTDIAKLKNGKAGLASDGSMVGEFKTQVKSASISTFGLGGDSLITVDYNNFKIGPNKVTPLCVAASKFINISDEMKKYSNQIFDINDKLLCFKFLKAVKNVELLDIHKKIISLVKNNMHSLGFILEHTKCEITDVKYLSELGILECSSYTPTDILHAKGEYTEFCKDIALLATEILANGQNTDEFLENAQNAIFKGLIDVCQQSLEKEVPIIALGASVCSWMPKVCERLNTKLFIPRYAEVANAIGAAVGDISFSYEVLIRYDKQYKKFLAYMPYGMEEFDDLELAKECAETVVKNYLSKKIYDQGGKSPQVVISHQYTYDENIKKEFIELNIFGTVIASPSW